MEIAIIGAGPVGCYTGYLLAEAGHNVSIYEKKSVIGLPVQCTGLLTSDFDKFGFDKSSFLVNTFENIEVNSPNNYLKIRQKEYLVCRKKFDNYFVNLALKSGARIFLNHSFLRKERESVVIKNQINNKEKHLTPDIVIAADGPLSQTAKAYGFYHPERENYYGIQTVVEGNFDSMTYRTFFGNGVCPDLFAWIVPESSTTARVGLAAKKSAGSYFSKFMKRQGFTAKEMQAGVIPLFHPKQRLKKGNCYLVGDASGYVKATTLGGIVPAFKQARILVDCINDGRPVDYNKETKLLRREMKIHLRVQKILNKFSDKDWDRLLDYVNQPKIQKVLEKHTRDNPIPLVTKTLLKEPRFLFFLKYVF